MVKTLKILGWIAGISLIVLGVGRIVAPVATIPGGGTLNATLDSETRAGGALLIGMGWAYVWAVRQSAVPVTAVRFLAVVMGLLAATRLVSWAATGLPHPIFVVAAGVEFTVSALTYWYSTMGGRSTSLGQIATQDQRT
jgi:hypothetical protein